MAFQAGNLKGDDETLNDIIRTNPIYKYRLANNQSIRAFALYVGVSHSSVDNWEKGLMTPTDENFVEIARVMKRSVKGLRNDWQRWIDRSKESLQIA